MYKVLLAFYCFAFASFAGEFTTDQSTFALYHFNEGQGSILTDVSGNGNNGTITGGTWINGEFGKALQFNGTSDYALVNKSLLVRNVSFEMWVYPTVNTTDNTQGWAFTFAPYGWYSGGFGVKGDSVQFSTSTNAKAKGKLQSNEWNYLAMTIDNQDTMWLYVNGALVSKVKDAPEAASRSWSRFYFGATYYTSVINFFKGSIDETRISNTVRSASEIKAYWDSNNIPTNNPPGFISTPDTLATQDLLWSYTITAVDVDAGDLVSYSLRTPLSGMSLSGNTVTWTPTNANVGSNIVTIRATDSRGAFSDQTFRVHVINVNEPPTIISAAPTAAVQNQLFSYQAQASDPDAGDVLMWQLTTAPPGMNISASGLVTWTPTQAQVGSNNVVIQVRDAAGATAQQSFSITVTNVNDAPVITDQISQNATEDIPFSLQLAAIDPDGNQVFWFVVQAPESLKVNMSSGFLTWTPRQNVAGTTVQVKIRATDAVLSDTTTFSITVTAVNDPPVITTVLPSQFKQDTLYSIPLTATDEEGNAVTWSVPRKPATMNIIGNMLVWAPTILGLDTITIIATDGNGFDTLSSLVQVLTDAVSLSSSHSALPVSLGLAVTRNIGSISITAGLPVNSGSGTITIFNISGKRLAEKNISGVGWHTVTFSEVPAGAHLLRLNAGGKSIVQRFMCY
jgi:hypothetical protein